MSDCVLWNIINDINLTLSFLCALDFDLDKERIGLDEQGLKIAENQETSQNNRRKLAENTRDFKKHLQMRS
jgi:homeobox protein cut-like